MAQEVLGVAEQDRPLVSIRVRHARCRLKTETSLENSKQRRVAWLSPVSIKTSECLSVSEALI